MNTMVQGSPPTDDDGSNSVETTDAAADDDRVLSHTPDAVDSLKKAMRRARFDNAERTGAIAEFRQACLGRLEILREELRPLIAQIPKDVDLFDIGLMPSSNPRLFIDMIGFVEMGRDARVYRFMQDTRHARLKLAESEDVETIVEAVTAYVASRLLERDKALAADAVAQKREAPPKAPAPARVRGAPPQRDVPIVSPSRRASPAPLRWAGIGFAFLIDLLGSIAFFLILAGIGWVVWNRLHGQIS